MGKGRWCNLCYLILMYFYTYKAHIRTVHSTVVAILLAAVLRLNTGPSANIPTSFDIYQVTEKCFKTEINIHCLRNNLLLLKTKFTKWNSTLSCLFLFASLQSTVHVFNLDCFLHDWTIKPLLDVAYAWHQELGIINYVYLATKTCDTVPIVSILSGPD